MQQHLCNPQCTCRKPRTTVQLCSFLFVPQKHEDPGAAAASRLQLQCDKKQITAPLGSDFLLSCSYENQLLSNKYWCRGESRRTCEVLVDSEGKTRSTRVHIVDVRRRGLFVRVVDLQKGDSGVYWVGIDRPYADIMTSVSVVVTEDIRGRSQSQAPLPPEADDSTCLEPVLVVGIPVMSLSLWMGCPALHWWTQARQ
ncbi:hypothetical protein NQZ68_035039 [Dissostichus eleginoides]|nr:hypothetical protein NQZ68_035039 [Dissostichus eleginoides]